MKLVGEPFENGNTCKGEAFSDPKMNQDMSVIDISGRYPPTGWAKNRYVNEMVCVVSGIGTLAIKGAGVQEIEQGNVVSVAAGELFAWDGHMTIAMACNPPFNPEQYEIIEESSHEV